ncbi:MBL fold metallo-hydrolase [Novosphingobium sp. Gsoil 351]|uniref:MBL fold metallo-hydrolase n=1 Tax=Novosphingobium sp. Gsoil 351 TaxID=2675225 RepID=UPI0012B4C720|nr:MBL fold metallo-hydrolase [Novosphingobium sp. Gsoil 351]QGN55069.1 MBL fold metallo-hydrolase [Novosphingobium sp. Gsoil 351]
MLLTSFRDGEGCKSYIIGCEESCAAAIIDPALDQVDRYLGEIAKQGLRVRYVIDTHTHADHFSGARALRGELGAPIVMHRFAPAPYVDLRVEDEQSLPLGALRLRILHTPGHTRDSMAIYVAGHVFTGDTLLIGGTGRSDLPSGDPEQLHASLFGKLLSLPDETLVFPAHDYKGRDHSTIGDERAGNPRLAQSERGVFVELMNGLNLSAPTHLTEALRTNMSGGKTVRQMLAEAGARVPFMSMDQLRLRLDKRANDFIILDVREKDAFAAGHVPGAVHLPRGQLELRVNDALPDPGVEILAICEFGKISTLAAATLRELGFERAAALDGGMAAWRERGHPVEAAPST